MCADPTRRHNNNNNSLIKMRTVKYNGKRYRISESPRKNKQLRATNIASKAYVDFGDPSMPEYPGTKRGDNYCARSSGIKGKTNPKSANFWSRKYLWNCKGKKSLKRSVL